MNRSPPNAELIIALDHFSDIVQNADYYVIFASLASNKMNKVFTVYIKGPQNTFLNNHTRNSLLS